MSQHASALGGPPAAEIERTPLSLSKLGAQRLKAAVDRVRGEFAEMRGFSPTLAQASKLFGLTRDECDRVLKLLVQDGSLTRGEDGRYRLVE